MLKGTVNRDEMSLASKCGVARNGGSFCSESVGPEPGYVTVEPGERLTVRLGEGAGRVRGDIVRRKDGETTKQYAGAAKAKLVAGTRHRRWRFRLPGDLEDANAVLVYVTYRRDVRDGGDKVSSATFASKLRRPG